MMVAVMAQIVTMFRRNPGTATGCAACVVMIGLLALGGREAEQAAKRAMMVGIDRHVRTHAGLELAHVLVMAVEVDPHRYALHDLDEVAGGVLRRKDGELRTGAGAERSHGALESVIGESIDIDGDWLT